VYGKTFPPPLNRVKSRSIINYGECDLMEGDEDIPPTSIVIYGGKKTEVARALEDDLGITKDGYYHTWMSLGVLKRLGFLFAGGVESAGGLFEIVCMFAVLAIVVGMVFAWQFGPFAVTVLVLALLSGGDAFKFVKSTYVTVPLEDLDPKQVADFTTEQMMIGRYVGVKGDTQNADVRTAARATYFFKRGIQMSLVVATVFLVIELVCWLTTGHWLSGLDPVNRPLELPILIFFGVLFLGGVIIMDAGVLLRFRTARRLRRQARVVS